MGEPRTIVWYSCGAPSAVAARMTLRETPGALIVYCDTRSEHDDNVRFRADCEQWFGVLIAMALPKAARAVA